MSDYRLNQECKLQFKALVGGFRAIMPEKYIRFFSPRELQTLMSGENVDFDVDDLRRYVKYEGGYFDQHATIRAFWQVITEMSPKEKNAFLKFVTSCSNPPVGGFRHLEPPFTIRYVAAVSSDDVDTGGGVAQFGKVVGNFFGVGKEVVRLPTSSTCFNVLKLPAYQKKSALKVKLLYAIKSGAGFELS
ncbi:Ubiquitin-protein ligase E3B [Podochytrium sp. JEL0797]|nr:Ubiquitin-protein ligase E3B [Podochytrium sp. JEL0797]